METLNLIKAIKLGKIKSPTSNLIQLAAKNKILLHFLRKLNICNEVRVKEEYRFKYFIHSLEEVNRILSNSKCNYAFFKLCKPIEYVPADIDVLISPNDIARVIKEFIKSGYSLRVLEPYTATLTKNKTIVDLYTHPSFSNVIYLNGQKLLEYRRITNFNGVEIVSLETYAEVITTLTHAIDKEWIYTLNDYFTVSKWLNKKSIRLSEELNCEYEVKLAIKLNKSIERGYVEAPYKIPAIQILKIWSNKVRSNKYTRSTLTKLLPRINDRRLGKLIISRLTRTTY